MLLKILICFLAGAGAGLGTGFAGMSAAAVISPMLMTFLNIPAYEAVGIALASDVLASAVSAWTYYRHGNIDLKNGLIMMAFVLLFTVVGSWAASFMPNNTMEWLAMIVTILLGLKFLLRPVTTSKEAMEAVSRKKRAFQSIACGTYIGCICGFCGAGGGLMMLLVLTSVLCYELKTAVGTSVFIMTFTALTGSVSHFILGGMPDLTCLGLCIVFTFLWARIAARIANRATNKTLNQVTGIILLVLGVVILCVDYL